MTPFKCLLPLLCGSMLVMNSGASFALEPKSGYEYIKPATRAMQDDDFENPGMLAVERGLELFDHKQAGAGQSCAECHGKSGTKIDKKRIARYPIVNAENGAIISLQQTISECRERTGSKALPANHPDLIALETFVRNLAIDEVVNVQTDGAAAALLEQGETIFKTRYGLIDMSCAHCHSMYTGLMIRGQKISQGQANGFPAYRLDIGEMTNLDQRIQQCLESMRAEPFPADSEEIKLLGLYMMSRSNGLKIETPAVRY